MRFPPTASRSFPRNSATASWSCSLRSGKSKNAHPQQTGLDSDLGGNGENQHDLAATRYSEDPGSKYKGCYNNIGRGQFVPEFEGAVYETEIGDYSPVFESDLDTTSCASRTAVEQFSACHVLMKPTFDPKALDQMQARIDSVSAQLALGDVPFDMAVLKHSTREETRNQKGQVVNPRDGGTRFGVDELDPNIFFLLQDLEEGSISAPCN